MRKKAPVYEWWLCNYFNNKIFIYLFIFLYPWSCPRLQRDTYKGVAVKLHSFQNLTIDSGEGLSSGTSSFTTGWSPEAFWAVWKREQSAENRTTIPLSPTPYQSHYINWAIRLPRHEEHIRRFCKIHVAQKSKKLHWIRTATGNAFCFQWLIVHLQSELGYVYLLLPASAVI